MEPAFPCIIYERVMRSKPRVSMRNLCYSNLQAGGSSEKERQNPAERKHDRRQREQNRITARYYCDMRDRGGQEEEEKRDEAQNHFSGY